MRKGIGALVVLALISPMSARAEDAPPPAPAPKPAERLLIERLKDRALEWMNARRQMLITCPTCDGYGATRWQRPCGSCGGSGRKYAKDSGRKVFHDMRSPAWRARASAKDEAGQEFGALKIGDAATVSPKSWRWVSGELVDDTHGLSVIVEGSGTAVTTRRWVLATENGRATWFLWTEVADGPWPAGRAAPEEPAPEPLPKPLELELTAALHKTPATYRPRRMEQAAGVLVLTLAPPDGPKRPTDATIVTDAIAYARAVLGGFPSQWTAVRLRFLARFQDRFGERSDLPVWRAGMDAETYRKVRWENLTETQAWDLFDRAPEQHDGWTLIGR